MVDGPLLGRLSRMLKDIFHTNGHSQATPMGPEEVFEPQFFGNVDASRSVFADCSKTIGSKLRIFDLLTHTDLSYRGNIRNNLLNERIGNFFETGIVPIFAHSRLRNAVFGSPVAERFDPASYETTYADNKFFLKQALANEIDSDLLNRKKVAASAPSHVLWLLDSENSEFVRRSFKKLADRKIFRNRILELLETVRSRMISKDGRGIRPTFMQEKGWPTLDVYLRMLWKMLALEIWMEEFLD